MPKKKKKIDPVRGERLNIILKEKECSQVKLIELLKDYHVYPAETMSRIINGKLPFDFDLAEQIIYLFPEYNLGWLYGLSPYKTKAEIENIQHGLIEADRATFQGLLDIINYSFQKQGYQLRLCTPENTPKGEQFKNNNAYYAYKKGRYQFTIKIDGYNKLKDSILHYTDYLVYTCINSFAVKEGERDGKHSKKK